MCPGVLKTQLWVRVPLGVSLLAQATAMGGESGPHAVPGVFLNKWLGTDCSLNETNDEAPVLEFKGDNKHMHKPILASFVVICLLPMHTCLNVAQG